jgi:two-component system, sensor histidine kinase and response regulator
MFQTENELILIVDDEPRNLQLLGSFLKQQGYSVAVAQDGQQALDFVQKRLPDIILLDVMMPQMDGFEVCRRLKAIEAHRRIPVLFVTALTDTDNILKGFEVGGVDYINKPIIQSEVLARVRVHLENQRLVREMADANRDLIELNQLKNRFMGMAAHDLRNPLSGIIGFSELLLAGDFGELSEEQKPIIERLHATGGRMLNLVNDLLDVSVIESGRLTLRIEPHSLRAMIEEQLKLHRLTADKKQIGLVTDYQTEEVTEFDRERMMQVFDNLLGNAIKFSPAGSRIGIQLAHHADRIQFSISDQGPGLNEADQAKLFGTFQKLSAQPTAGEKGTGLGLAISQKIVEAHGGTIAVKNRPGGGATFTVDLPVLAGKTVGT